ncbi:MAG: bifunctional serine/threonine-protein kinase/ABC transporter substrate-binding protein [Oscillatoriaceae cyanobacterium Prado104]|jgi:ABC-type branched-subunit amino acid transport system substrate-binding protein|nr:bifunctional serine/threonine-protein kinase/ABC transporter substrate-binding protein [Oscillatoriaceae cyanobacterium Prado104]
MCLNPGDVLRDRYQIIAELGRGGFAITYTANDLHQPENSPCVVKEIQPPESNDPGVLREAESQFNREFITLQRLNNCDRIPNNCERRIPHLIDRFQERGKFYLIQEYIPGQPLRDELTTGMRLTQEQVIVLLQEILSIMEFVHGRGMVHRDIHPGNLIRRSCDSSIVLIDFGAVREISTLGVTNSGEISTTQAIGIRGYMPAEQLLMPWSPQPYNDIYAIGAIALQALTNIHPNNLPRDPQTCELLWHFSTPDRELPQVSDSLRIVLNKMVRFAYCDRYQSATEILEDLRSVTAPPPPPPLLSQPQVSPEPQPKWQDILRICLLVAIAGFAGLGAFFIHNFSQPKNSPLIQIDALSGGEETPIANSPSKSKTKAVFIQGDALSGGEEILIKNSSPRSKIKAVEEFAKSNYSLAFESFKKSWNHDYIKDPETLIYMNNTFLEANNIPYYTIAVALPVSNRKNPDRSVYMEDRGKEFLRGVAQAQTEVNLGLPNSSSDRDLPGRVFLPRKAINGKGLKIIIADDENDGEKAKQRAISLVDRPDILAVVGHGSSEMTMQSVDIYNNNNLVLMSPGAATEELTYEPRKNFFRNIYTSSVIAKDLAKYLREKKQKQAAILYNPGSPFGESFKEEFTKYFQNSRGRKIVSVRDFDLSKQDFNAARAIEEMRAKGETAIVLVPDPHLTVSLDRAFEIIKLNGDRNWIVGAWTLAFPQMLEEASKQKQNLFKKLVFSVSWHSLSSPNKEFPQQARSLWREEGNTRMASAYDATRAMIKALEMQPTPSREGMQKMLVSPDFTAYGATGTIKFNSPTNGDRKNPPSDLVHIVKCAKEQFGLTFVPVKYPTAAAAGLKCE